MDCSIVITDQYYENNCYHVTMASEGKDMIINPRCKAYIDGGLLQSFGDFCPFVRLYGKGRLRESTHLRIIGHQGRVVTLSPAIMVCSCGCHSVPCWSVVNAVIVRYY